MERGRVGYSNRCGMPTPSLSLVAVLVTTFLLPLLTFFWGGWGKGYSRQILCSEAALAREFRKGRRRQRQGECEDARRV